MMDFAAARKTMVENQLRTYDILDYDTLEVMGRIPREKFVPEGREPMAYLDQSIDLGAGRALMTPMVFGRLLQALSVRKTDKVLDIAGSTGYSTAAFAMLAHEVVLLDEDEASLDRARANLAEHGLSNVRIIKGEIAEGHAAEGPYDVIFINGSIAVEPSAVLAQLSDGGRLGAVVDFGRSGRGMIYRKSGGHVTASRVIDAEARPLSAFQRPVEFKF